MPAPSFMCPHCQKTSYNTHDIANRYCGACHHFCDDLGRMGTPGEVHHAGPPDKIQPIVPDGAVMRFYDSAGRLILERLLAHTNGTDWHQPADAAAAVDEGLADLSLILYDGATGARTPITFGMVCRLRNTAAS